MSHLIIYTTNHGATKECVERIAEHLRSETDIFTIDEIEPSTISRYDHVILGTPIYATKPPARFVEFCDQHEDLLLSKPLSLFICGLVDTPEKQVVELEAAFSKELRNHATQSVFLGGRLTYQDLSLPEKALMKMLKQDHDQDTFNDATIRTFAEAAH